MPSAESDPARPAGLSRSLTLVPLILYGMGVIVGAGIYVALGAVVRRAGDAAPLSFLLAGGSAALTGLCYAELAARYPEAAGAAAYVRHGFRSKVAGVLVTLAITAATAIAAASIAHGAAVYIRQFAALDSELIAGLVIVANAALAIYGVRASVGVAAVIGALEALGLVAAIGVGFYLAPDFRIDGLAPSGVSGWRGTLDGAFIAYFAFIGFETLANMAEEVKAPTRTVPAGILGAIVASGALYLLVAFAVVLAERTGEKPLIDLFEGHWAWSFSAIGAVSIANGVLVEIVMLSRLFYGMARAGALPQALARVNGFTRTPVVATLVAAAIVLATALLAPFERLLNAANAIMLTIFLAVDAALLLIKLRDRAPAPAFRAPLWVPVAAMAATIVLLVVGGLG